MPELLIELFSEEIPARMQVRAAEDLAKALHTQLGALMPAAPRSFSGPRRLAVVGEMAARAETAPKEERGPRVGAPEAALEGFLRKHGASREQLVQEGQFWVLHKPGEVLEAADLLARAVPAVLRNFPWPKSMRWGTSPFLWVRPLQRVVCLLGGEAVRFPLEHHIVSGDATEGHRVMAPGGFRVTDFASYQAGLRDRRVVLDAAERMALIRDGVARLAAAEGLEVVPDEGLLAEVAGLVEWPVPLLGSIDAAFMDLPPEVMRTTMRINQKYFALRHPDGRAAPRFALVANIEAIDGGRALVAGNERVLRARLSDARFFWDLDRKQKLEDYLPKLETVVFHAKLGTQGERVRRLVALAEVIAGQIGADVGHAMRAAKLAKADLATGMVGEFPELQGVMGRYYALGQHEPAQVAEAVAEHYRPLGAGDAVPTDGVAIAVALADKLDQLAGFFTIGEFPTGSADPFALRRAALGVYRIVAEKKITADLPKLWRAAINMIMQTPVGQSHVARLTDDKATERRYSEIFQGAGDLPLGDAAHVEMTVGIAHHFLIDRVINDLRAKGLRHDYVAAALGRLVKVADLPSDIASLSFKAFALRGLIESADGANLLAAYRRAANILRIEEKKDGPHNQPVDPRLLAQLEEQALHAALDQAAPQAARLLAEERFGEAMAALATLRAPLDAFFDKIMVNAPEPELRRNRLALLARLRAAMDSVADLSKIEG